MSAGSGKGEEESGSREANAPGPFAAVMREWRLTGPAALLRSIDDACHGDSARDVPSQKAGGAHLADAVGVAGAEADPHRLLDNAEQLLDRVLEGACESRNSALDLLTIDALVTRAMESALRDPKLFGAFPELAMKRLSSR